MRGPLARERAVARERGRARLTGGAGLTATEGGARVHERRWAAWATRGGGDAGARERGGWAGFDPTEGGEDFPFSFSISISISISFISFFF
jgi:hypothetical protein